MTISNRTFNPQSYSHQKYSHGFTLIEIIMVVGLIGLVTLYLYEGYKEEMNMQRVRAVVKIGQDIVNAAELESYGVTNPDVSDYDYSLPLADNTTFTTLAGRAIRTDSVFHGIPYSGDTFVSDYDFARSTGLLNVEIEVPGVDFEFIGVSETTSDFGVADASDDMTTLTLYPRSETNSLVDLTAISRYVKSEYYWQLRK